MKIEMPANDALPQMSLLLLLSGSQVLLGRKKRGFGVGKITGIGGRREKGEAIEETVVREALEEVGVKPLTPKRVAMLKFFFPHQPSWSQQVFVYLASAWEGEPTESEEIAPVWIETAHIPYSDMWSDAPYWLPHVLAGEVLDADFVFTPGLEVEDFALQKKLTLTTH